MKFNKLHKKALRIFSEYIRVKAADKKGYCYCVTCGKRIKWKGTRECQAGHFISKNWEGTRYDERNCNPQCSACNAFGGGEPAAYAQFILDEYGSLAFGSLNFYKRCFISNDELKKKIEWWKSEIKKYKREKKL